MFATVIIVLPSAYTGGQVVLSHSSMKKTIDFSKISPTSTALLAWYTDVKDEVKEVTSGYRLALSYNLVNVASSRAPRHTMPDMLKSPSLLRKVLKKWRAKKYDEFEGSNPRVAACLLKHEYSPENLKDGLKALKGADAHKVSFIRPAAEELGFMVGVASLNYYETGEGDDYGGYRYRSYYHDDYDNEDEDDDAHDGGPNMVEVESTRVNIEGLVDSDGLLLLSEGQIALDDRCLIPKHAFKDVVPDDVEYEGYLGNQSGNVEHWYQRTALVLIRKSEVDDICYEAGGASFAFERLEKSSTTAPTDQDRRWAMCLLQKHMVMSKLHALTLIDYAFKWKDLDIWKGVMRCPTSTFENIDTALLLEAWKLFSFEAVCLSFEEFLARSRDLQERMQFIYSLPAQCASSELQKVRTWCRKESNKILSSYNPINMKDIPVIMSVIRTDGLEAFARTMMPNLLKKPSSYDFLLALRKALFDERQSILDRQADPQPAYSLLEEEPQTTDEVLRDLGASSVIQEDLDLNPTVTLLNKVTKLCLDTAATQWFDTDEHRHQIFHQRSPHNSKIKRIIEIIEHAVGTSDMDLTKTLLVDILKAPGEKPITFIQIYTPLIPRLKALLAKMNLDLEAPPYISFIQILIGSYLHDVLGAKIDLPPKGLRKIGCGCADCKPLDVFILNPTTTTTTFPMAQMRRSHLEQRITSAGADLCTFTTIKSGSPHI
ncbi:hypothetical protein HYPSUDRAFT_1039386 [Hypholoma sublateritium FD-334 SS-4]|uniref:Uncharacterized protein n=1 Tax=Hypholoma sublateritium (strain FD-334 SS-4) TaxID=945553 RepID=A0A0D2P7L5_HYPSF|nr:hypothetical protein HYPSUDRAFT_1039386 [Hypholoma sublateritium FD-334 SS-4]